MTVIELQSALPIIDEAFNCGKEVEKMQIVSHNESCVLHIFYKNPKVQSVHLHRCTSHLLEGGGRIVSWETRSGVWGLKAIRGTLYKFLLEERSQTDTICQATFNGGWFLILDNGKSVKLSKFIWNNRGTIRRIFPDGTPYCTIAQWAVGRRILKGILA